MPLPIHANEATNMLLVASWATWAGRPSPHFFKKTFGGSHPPKHPTTTPIIMAKGVFVSSRAPSVSHLLFADDTLIFCLATKEAASTIDDILHGYSLASGQTINLDKSIALFSRNVGRDRIEDIQECFPIRVVEKLEKYLGLPT